MNLAYKSLWNAALGAWVAVAEIVAAKGKSSSGGRRSAPFPALIKFKPSTLVAAIALMFGCAASAQTLFWDGTSTGANADGGNGTWDTTTANWDTAATAGANTTWTNGADAEFDGVSGNVNITAGGVSAHNLNFTVGYSLSGGILTLTGANPTITTGGNTTISNVIAGSNGLIKSGTAVLTLNGTNTFSGVTQLQQGSLSLGNQSALGSDNALIANAGTAIGFSNAVYSTSLQLTGGTVTLSGTGATWSAAPTLTADTTLDLQSANILSGNLSDNGAQLSVSVSGANSPRLSGTNTYSGPTTVNSGQLTIIGAGALSPSSNLVLNGTPAAAWVATTTLSSAFPSFTRGLGTGANQVRWTGSGGFASAGTPGTVQTVNIGGSSAQLVWGVTPNFVATTGQLMLGTGNNVAGGATLDFQNPLQLPTGGTTYDLAVFNGAVSGAAGSTAGDRARISGAISGPGNLRVGGGVAGAPSSLLELSGTNTYTGALILNGGGNYGNVLLTSAGSLGPGNLQFAGPASSIGDTISLTSASGDFTRPLGTGANQVQWTGSGGFSAAGSPRQVNIGGAGAQLTWGSGGFVPTGSWLNFAANSAGNDQITFVNPIDLGAAVRTVNVGSGGTARLSGVLSNGGITYQGGGSITPSGANTYTGITTIAVNTRVNVSAIGNGGTAGNLGQATSANANIVVNNNGQIIYTGSGETSDRGLTVNPGIVSLVANGTGAWEWGTATGAAAAQTLTLSGTSAATLVNSVNGVIDNGAATALGVTKSGTNTWRLAGLNTYTGPTALTGGTLVVNNLQDGGVASNLGASTSAAANLTYSAGSAAAPNVLRYDGAGSTTNRNFRNGGGSFLAIESSGSGPLVWNGTYDSTGVSNFNNLIFGGTNTGANVYAGVLNDPNNDPAVGHMTSLTKRDAGTWAMSADNNARSDSYVGNTTVSGGMLRLDGAGVITGGLGTSSNHGALGSSQRSSLIVFNDVPTGGVIGLTAASGNFSRGLNATAPQAFLDNNGTNGNPNDDNYVQAIRWSGSGGFAGIGGTRTVNLGGSGLGVTWATNGFVPTGSALILGSASADGTVDFQNPIALGAATRTVRADDGTAAVDGILSGPVSGTGGFAKSGAGTLAFVADNTYSGATDIQAGTLQLGNGGTTGAISATAGNINVAGGATIAVNHSNALTVANTIVGAANSTLAQIGGGATTLGASSNAVGNTVVTGGSLSVLASNTLSSDTLTMGSAQLNVAGLMQTAGAGALTVSNVAGTSSTLNVQSGGTLRASGDLGDGNDTVSLAGVLDSGTGGLTLGDGNDQFSINEGGSIASTGLIDAGLGNDTLTVNTSSAFTLAGNRVANFETLTKNNTGILTLTGSHSYATATNLSRRKAR